MNQRIPDSACEAGLRGWRRVWGEGDTSWPFPCSFRTLGGPLSTRPNPLSANSHVICALYHRFRQGQLRISDWHWRFSRLPDRLGLVDVLAAEAFEEVGIHFVGAP